ncbi:MAG: ribonuclease III domain-containing protein, partial [bacterium]
SKLIELFLPLLSEEEIQIYKKGRNSRPQNVPKSASVEEYRKSTGFECLVGFWMLRDESERFDQLMNDENVQPFIESFIYSSRSIKPL